MAAPVAAKIAVHAAQSKAVRRTAAAVLAIILATVAAPFVLLFGVATMALANVCATTIESVDGFSDVQLKHAETIISVGADRDVPEQGIKIALMVALVETNLRNLANPTVPASMGLPNDGTGSDHDSVGLFQQRPSQGWGTVPQLMDPVYSAGKFYERLTGIPGWESLKPGDAAQKVQISAFPDRYAERAGEAEQLLGGSSTSAADCPAESADGVVPVEVKGGWAHPLGNATTWSTYPGHAGGAVDFPVPVGTPVYAPAAGIVRDFSEACGGTVIGVQNDQRYTTVFAHLSRVAVTPGTAVKAGQVIGYSGVSGSCVNGAHLHLEVRTGPNPAAYGSFTPAYRFMKSVGIDLGPCYSGCNF
ncbi:MAG: M23 family metallopeptidase [Leucobacter sp.]